MKKLLIVLGMITCMIGLTACGSQTDNVDRLVTDEEAVMMGERTVDSMQMIIGQGAADQYAEDEIVYQGILSLESAMDDIGSYLGTDGGSVTYNKDEIVINVNVLGSSHNAVMEIVLDSSLTSFVSISTNVTYTFGELMAKAGLNTLIGMGTVFAILILISLIISAFTIISKIQNAGQKKAEAAKAEVAADPVVAQIAEKEELASDAELVAVIAAAIAAYEGSGSTDGFVVRSIRKANKSKWQNA